MSDVQTAEQQKRQPTDQEKFTALLTEFGVGFTVETKDVEGEQETVIRCTEGNAKIDGYLGFFAVFSFDKNGKFLEMGVWE